MSMRPLAYELDARRPARMPKSGIRRAAIEHVVPRRPASGNVRYGTVVSVMRGWIAAARWRNRPGRRRPRDQRDVDVPASTRCRTRS